MTRVVAIDGPAGSGKSTVAKALAEALTWSYLDTGAMYRAVTAEALHLGINPSHVRDVEQLARRASISTIPTVTINGRDVGAEIRTTAVNEAVSVVAANAGVRTAMVALQRLFAGQQPRGTVVEGRDITTVVFPDATLKVFLTADLAERARRRGEESAESVARRDHLDSSRDVSPLRQAEDALVIDTTNRAIASIVEEIVLWLSNNNRL